MQRYHVKDTSGKAPETVTGGSSTKVASGAGAQSCIPQKCAPNLKQAVEEKMQRF